MNTSGTHTDRALRDRVDTDGGRVAVDVLGDGPPVVLTHGTPSWSYLWRHVAADLARDHTVHLWDLLGYGDSETDVRPSVARHAATLAELVEHWGLTGERSAALVGHDIGAGTVLRAHLLHGVPARALVLLDAAVLGWWVTPATTAVQANLDDYRAMPNDEFAELVAGHLATATVRPLPDDVAHAYLDRFAGDEGQQRWLDHVAGFTDDDTRGVVERLGEIAVPTRVIWGEQDRWLELATAGRLRDAIPGADLSVVPDAGHFLVEDDAATTIAAIRETLVA